MWFINHGLLLSWLWSCKWFLHSQEKHRLHLHRHLHTHTHQVNYQQLTSWSKYWGHWSGCDKLPRDSNVSFLAYKIAIFVLLMVLQFTPVNSCMVWLYSAWCDYTLAASLNNLLLLLSYSTYSLWLVCSSDADRHLWYFPVRCSCLCVMYIWQFNSSKKGRN